MKIKARQSLTGQGRTPVRFSQLRFRSSSDFTGIIADAVIQLGFQKLDQLLYRNPVIGIVGIVIDGDTLQLLVIDGLGDMIIFPVKLKR